MEQEIWGSSDEEYLEDLIDSNIPDHICLMICLITFVKLWDSCMVKILCDKAGGCG